MVTVLIPPTTGLESTNFSPAEFVSDQLTALTVEPSAFVKTSLNVTVYVSSTTLLGSTITASTDPPLGPTCVAAIVAPIAPVPSPITCVFGTSGLTVTYLGVLSNVLGIPSGLYPYAVTEK